MKIFSESNFARVSALVSVLILGALGPQALYSSSLSAEATRHLLIQGSDVGRLVDLVESVGGTVSEELSVLNAVSVEVTPAQLDRISRSADVHRILDDRKVAGVELAGSWWDSDVPLAGDADTQLAGSWWDSDVPLAGDTDVQLAGSWWDSDIPLPGSSQDNQILA